MKASPFWDHPNARRGNPRKNDANEKKLASTNWDTKKDYPVLAGWLLDESFSS